MKIIFLILLLISCGAEKSAEDGAKASADQASEEAKRIPTMPETLAKFYATEAEMPVCNKENYRTLVYLESAKEFQYCDSSNEWTVINIQGSTGKDGKNGKDGKDGQDGSLQVWRHPVNNSRWYLGQTFSYYDLMFLTPKLQLCATGSRVPSIAEFEDAMLSGFWNQFKTTINTTSIQDNFILEIIDVAVPYKLIAGNGVGSSREYNVNSVADFNRRLYSICIVQ